MRNLLIPVAALGLVLAAGCITAPGSGKPVYTLQRHLTAYQTLLAVPIEKAHKATVEGLADLKIRPLSSSVDKLTGLADGCLADGTDFEVRLVAKGDAQTLIRIRCGLLGDPALAAQIFHAIEARL
jgi:hypothetical protein